MKTLFLPSHQCIVKHIRLSFKMDMQFTLATVKKFTMVFYYFVSHEYNIVCLYVLIILFLSYIFKIKKN